MASCYSPRSTDTLFSLPNVETKPRKRKRKNLSKTGRSKVEDKRNDGSLRIANYAGHTNLLCDLNLESSLLKHSHGDTSRNKTSEATPRSALKNGKYRTIISYRRNKIQTKSSSITATLTSNGKNEVKNIFDSLGNLKKPTNIPITSFRNESPQKRRKQMVRSPISANNEKKIASKLCASPRHLASSEFGKEAHNSLLSIPFPKLMISSAKSQKLLPVTPKKSKMVSLKKKSSKIKRPKPQKRKASLNPPKVVVTKTRNTRNTSVTKTSTISKKPSKVILEFWNTQMQKNEDEKETTNKIINSKNTKKSYLTAHKNNNVDSAYLNNHEIIEPVVKNLENKQLSTILTNNENELKTEKLAKENISRDSSIVTKLDENFDEPDNLSQQSCTAATNINHSDEVRNIVIEPTSRLGRSNYQAEDNSAIETSTSSKSDKNFDESFKPVSEKDKMRSICTNQHVDNSNINMTSNKNSLIKMRPEFEFTNLDASKRLSSNERFINSQDQSFNSFNEVQANNLEIVLTGIGNDDNYATHCHTSEVVESNESTQVPDNVKKRNNIPNFAPYEAPTSFGKGEMKHLSYSKDLNPNSGTYKSVKVNIQNDEGNSSHLETFEPNTLVFVKEQSKPYSSGGFGRIAESKFSLPENTYKVKYVLGGWEAKVHANRIEKVSNKALQQKYVYETRTQLQSRHKVIDKRKNQNENNPIMEDDCEKKIVGNNYLFSPSFTQNKKDVQPTLQNSGLTDSYHNADALFTALRKAHMDNEDDSHQIQQQVQSEVIPFPSLIPYLDRTPNMISFYTPKYSFADEKKSGHSTYLSIEKLNDVYSIISQENTPLHLPMAKTMFERVEFPILQHAQCKRSEFDIISLQRNDIFQRMHQLYFEIKSSLKKISQIENNKINSIKINRQVLNKQTINSKQKQVSSLENINTPCEKIRKIKRRSRSASGRKQLKPIMPKVRQMKDKPNQRKYDKKSKNKDEIDNSYSTDESSYADTVSSGKDNFDSEIDGEQCLTKKCEYINTNVAMAKKKKKMQVSSSHSSKKNFGKEKRGKIKDYVNTINNKAKIREDKSSFLDQSQNNQLSLDCSSSLKNRSPSNSSGERIRNQNNKKVLQPHVRSYSSLSDASMSSYDSAQRIRQHPFLRQSNLKRYKFNPKRYITYSSKLKSPHRKFEFSLKKNQDSRRFDEEQIRSNGHIDYKRAKLKSTKRLHPKKHEFLSRERSSHSYSPFQSYPLSLNNEHNGRIVKVQNDEQDRRRLYRSKSNCKRSTSVDTPQRRRKKMKSFPYISRYLKSIASSEKQVSQSLHGRRSHERQIRSRSCRRSVSPSNTRSILEEI